MVDVTRKHVAPAYRILVDAKAFLNTTINDAVLFFTASEIELMRNLVDYANRRSTFVSDYYMGYYLSPDDTDWNLIQSRVADLEEKLMGNNNVLWGYTDRYMEAIEEPDMPAGESDILGTVVPEGEVWEVTGMSARVLSGVSNRIRVGMMSGTAEVYAGETLSPNYAEIYVYHMDLILKEGDRLFWRFYQMLLNDNADCWAWGSKMEVPA